MIIHLVRHGQTQTGEDGLYLPDAGLTELGRQQAHEAAGRVVQLNPEAAYTSTLPRAIETAGFFSELTGKPAQQIANLAELDTGNIWVAADSVKAKIRSGDYTVDYKSMGGETPEEFSVRVKIGFAELLAAGGRFGAKSIVGFLHEGVIQTILDHLDGFVKYDNYRRGPMPNGALVTIDTEQQRPFFPGKWETTHLSD